MTLRTRETMRKDAVDSGSTLHLTYPHRDRLLEAMRRLYQGHWGLGGLPSDVSRWGICHSRPSMRTVVR